MSMKPNNEWTMKISALLLSSVAGISVGSLQPQEKGEARDVEVPLGSKQLHVHVVIHVGIQLGIFAGLCPRVLLNLSHGICEEQWVTIKLTIIIHPTFCHAERNPQTQPAKQHRLFYAGNQKKHGQLPCC